MIKQFDDNGGGDFLVLTAAPGSAYFSDAKWPK